MKKRILLIAALIGALNPLGCAREDSVQPLEIPPEYGFPQDRFTLLRYLDEIDIISMRRHAWNLWAGVTHRENESDAAVFETWYPADYVFHQEDQPPSILRSVRTHFEDLNQSADDAPGASLISHVLYNESSYNHIRDNKLYIRQTIDDLNTTFDRNNTPGWDRSVPQFPLDAIVIKPVWWHVKKDTPTPLPVWDGPYEPLDSNGNYPAMDPDDWPLATLIIPPGAETPSNTQSIAGTNANQRIRGTNPISDFYYFEITQEMLDNLDDDEQPNFDHVEAGDFAALIAMHVTTREIASWVWATYWWHDRPDQGPLAEDRPESVTGVWAHFLMETAFSIDTPGASDKGPHIAYNPYIEAVHPNGAQSNCMACHNRAAIPALSQSNCGILPITRGSHDFLPTSPERRTRTKLEFLYSLLFRTISTTPSCMGSSDD